MNLDEWEQNILDRIKLLKQDYNHIMNLSFKVKYNELSTPTEDAACDTCLKIIRKEIQELEAELIVYRILLGEDF